jgi:ABC-type amino acid transport substrate-binding protein
MKKSLITIALLLAFAAAVLTGCSPAAPAQSSAAASETPSASVAVSESASVAESAAPSESASPSASASTSAEKKTLIMGTNAAFPPYEFKQGDKVVGIDAEIAQAIADKLGMNLEIQDMEFDAMLAAIPTGKIDFGMAGITVTEDRKKTLDFSNVYATGKQVIIVKEDSKITGPKDLKGKLIGVQLSTTGDIYCTGDYGDEAMQRFSKGPDAIQALLQSKVDAVVIDNEPAKVFVSQNKGLKILPTEYITEDYAIAVAKDNKALLDNINTALAELTDAGTIKEIVGKYIKAE